MFSYGDDLALVIERFDQKSESSMIEELKELKRGFEWEDDIKHFLFHHGFPVDVRHNIKIDRLKLAKEFEEKR